MPVTASYSRSEALASSLRKLARGRYHIQDLDRLVKAFSDGKPYAHSVEPNLECGNKRIHKIKLIRPFPEVFADIAGDAVNNLRRPLDHACYAVAVASGKVRPPARLLALRR